MLTEVITLDFVTERCFLTLHLKIFVGFFQYTTTNHSACFMDRCKHHPREGISNVFGSEAGSIDLSH
jgi:hypothetical protein